MKVGKEKLIFTLFIIFIFVSVLYLTSPKSFGRNCSCSPQCDFASLRLDSCVYSSNTLKLKLTNLNIVNLNIIQSYLVYPNKTYEARYLTDHLPSFTSKEISIQNIPDGISEFTITTECPNIKIVKNITDCYYQNL